MAKIIPSNKILLALQFWDGDRTASLRLADLLADLEPKHSDLADFLFVCRFDSGHDQATIRKVSRKFNVFSYVSKGRGTGWPLGCNSLFSGTIGWFYHKALAGQIPAYKALFTFEGDGIPMRKDWVKGLHEEWDLVNAKKKVFQAGAWIPNGPYGPSGGHINGNCLLSGDFAFMKWLTRSMESINVAAGWDWIFAPQFRQWGWSDIPKIRSAWRTALTEKDFLAGAEERRVWHHGIKDDFGIKMCRKHLL